MSKIIQALFPLFLFSISTSFLFAQSAISSGYKTYTINLQKHGQQNIERFKLQDQKAQDFDAADFISKHISDYNVSIWGTVMKDGEVTKYQFDSKNVLNENNCTVYCEELLEIEQVALLGVSTKGDEDFEGAIISTVVPKSAANNAGLQPEDLITFIDETPIHSGCDLKLAIRKYTVGEEVQVTYIRGEKEETAPAILSYTLNKKMTWVPCCNTPVEGIDLPFPMAPSISSAQLTLFPNPTEGFAYLNFSTELDQVVKIIVTDVNGRTVFQREVADFDGTLDQVLDLTAEPSGIFFVSVIQGEAVFVERLVVVDGQ